MNELTTPTTTALTPPEHLTPPAAVAAVSAPQSRELVPLSEAQRQELDARAENFVNAILNLDAQGEDFRSKADALRTMGDAEIRATANMSNRMLERPMANLEAGFFNEAHPVTRSLVDLRKTMEDLDPSNQGDLLAPKKLFGIIPWGDKLRDFFLRYQSAQGHLNKILETLYKGQDELRKDNAAIEQEKSNLWASMGKLREYAEIGQAIDQKIVARVSELQATDPEKARIVQEDLLFNARQKVQDLLTQLAVSIQGYLALDMIRKNNFELIKGVDRASTTTVSALRTAVMVAQALGNQKLVLDQINALNTTTSGMIESTAKMLRQQSADIHKQASSAAVNIDSLKRAFTDIYATMDDMATYKVKALENMKQTVDVLNTEIHKSQTYLDRVRGEKAQTEVARLNMPSELTL
ncbi:MAG: toxic anion resistance protein [Gammaproteobacteria bacterium 28-57-27]|nr:MAG: toxic anion resistance protein [Gammaproteobacteria bacterium 28-57-27]